MKSKRMKMEEYDKKYSSIPKDYKQRLLWLYDTLKIDDAKSAEILQARDNFINSTYYKTLRIIMYEVPDHTPRPRARLITKKDIFNAAYGNNNFIQIYSITGRENKEYMEMYMKDNHIELEQLLCTPCDVEYRTYFPTPSVFNARDKFLAEIGLIRPINKPDWDNIGKSYSDAMTDNVWIDDIIVVDATVRKYYSVLPRVEIDLKYANQLPTLYQYKQMIGRKGFTEEMNIDYFGG